MFEETNQTIDQLPDNLFTEDNEEFEGIEEVGPENNLNAEAGAADGTPAQTAPEFLRIKYNGEEKDLTMDEARVLAQKGMNYDKILGERDQMGAVIDAYASASNMSREEFISYLNKALADRNSEADIAKLRKSYPGASDDLLRELADRDRKIKDAEDKERLEREKADADAAAQKPWLDFFTRHPEIKPEDLSTELLKAVEDGMSPEEAYLTAKLAEMEGKNEITRQNEKNMISAVGSAKGDGNPGKKDPFLEGFYGAKY